MVQQTMGNSCILPLNVFYQASVLADPTTATLRSEYLGRVYQLQCLAQLTEALVLYDRVIIPHGFHSLLGIPLHLLSEIVAAEPEAVTFVSATDGLSRDVQQQITTLNGMMLLGDMAVIPETYRFLPDWFLNSQVQRLDRMDQGPLAESLGSHPMADLLSQFCDKAPADYKRYYAANLLWQIDWLRAIRERESAKGAIVTSALGPLWLAERKVFKSNLHEKFGDATKAIQIKYQDERATIDTAPLLVVLLDTTLTVEKLPETLVIMRNDYRSLREIGKQYEQLLDSAQTYGDIADCCQEWSDAWTKVISQIGKPKHSSLREIFGWDLVAATSWKSIAVKTAKVLSRRLEKK